MLCWPEFVELMLANACWLIVPTLINYDWFWKTSYESMSAINSNLLMKLMAMLAIAYKKSLKNRINFITEWKYFVHIFMTASVRELCSGGLDLMWFWRDDGCLWKKKTQTFKCHLHARFGAAEPNAQQIWPAWPHLTALAFCIQVVWFCPPQNRSNATPSNHSLGGCTFLRVAIFAKRKSQKCDTLTLSVTISFVCVCCCPRAVFIGTCCRELSSRRLLGGFSSKDDKDVKCAAYHSHVATKSTLSWIFRRFGFCLSQTSALRFFWNIQIIWEHFWFGSDINISGVFLVFEPATNCLAIM